MSDLTAEARVSIGEFEILLIRDSRDVESAVLLSQLEHDFNETRQVKLSRNYGQQAATVAGIVESSGDIIVTLDDDYQHQPSDAIKMFKILSENSEAQLVYARPISPSDSPGRVRSGKQFRQLLQLSGLPFATSLSPFRAFRGNLRGAFLCVEGPNVSVDVILSWVVEEVKTVECEFRTRTNGVSGYTTLSLVKLALGVLLNYSTRPLRVGIYLGLAGVVLSFIFGTIIGVQYLLGGISVAGFATTTLLVLFMGSLQLLVLGIIGIYIGEQHQRGMHRPAYLVEQHMDSDKPERK